MATLPIRIYGDPCLRETAAPVEKIDEQIQQLILDMADTMYEARGIGLAAPQVGAGVRIFVADVDYERSDDGLPADRHLKVFINPEIVWESEEDEPFTEGCLSIPEVEGEVYRPSSVTMRYLDEKGRVREQRLEELEARCAQHELDHLNGILFIDRMAPLKRRFLAGRLNSLKRNMAIPAE